MKLATAVILSYDRQDSLRRQICYYANKPVHLILADGSAKDWGGGELGSVGEMTWEYFRISGIESYVPRLKMAFLKVKTEYCFLLDDEDCILWTGIESAISFLNQNEDHSCASGRVDWMGPLGGKLAIGPWGRWSKPLSLMQTDAMERLSIIGESKRTANLFYVVMRSRDAKNFTQVLDVNFKLDGHSLIFIELYIASFFALAGKWKMGAYPFWIRYSNADAHEFSNKSSLLFDGEALELQELLKTALGSASRECAGDSFKIEASEIMETLNRYFGSEKISENQVSKAHKSKFIVIFDFKNIIISTLVKVYLILLKQFCPGTYKLRPRGLMRMRRFAKMHRKRSESVHNDVMQVARLWTRFPSGVGLGEMTEVLRLNEKI